MRSSSMTAMRDAHLNPRSSKNIRFLCRAGPLRTALASRQRRAESGSCPPTQREGLTTGTAFRSHRHSECAGGSRRWCCRPRGLRRSCEPGLRGHSEERGWRGGGAEGQRGEAATPDNRDSEEPRALLTPPPALCCSPPFFSSPPYSREKNKIKKITSAKRQKSISTLKDGNVGSQGQGEVWNQQEPRPPRCPLPGHCARSSRPLSLRLGQLQAEAFQPRVGGRG